MPAIDFRISGFTSVSIVATRVRGSPVVGSELVCDQSKMIQKLMQKCMRHRQFVQSINKNNGKKIKLYISFLGQLFYFFGPIFLFND
jgi:hypothetical protein